MAEFEQPLSDDRQDFLVHPGGHVGGEIAVPGDKSISHRALLLGAVAEGTTVIEGFLHSDDCLATLNALRALGVEVRDEEGALRISGVGPGGLRAPDMPLDLGNSGTAMRLLAGVLAAQSFDCELTGDESLQQRPMERVAEPLRAMGAELETREGRAPLRIKGGRALSGIDYTLPVASAQLKSALLLAGLWARDELSFARQAPAAITPSAC